MKLAHAPIHPGEILLEEFLKPLGLSQYRVAKDISVPARRINEIVHGRRGITANTALRLARYFGTTEQFWMKLQVHFDLDSEQLALFTPPQELVAQLIRDTDLEQLTPLAALNLLASLKSRLG